MTELEWLAGQALQGWFRELDQRFTAMDAQLFCVDPDHSPSPRLGEAIDAFTALLPWIQEHWACLARHLAAGAAPEVARSEPVFADDSTPQHHPGCYGDHTGPCVHETGFAVPPDPAAVNADPHLVRPYALVAGARGSAPIRDEQGNVVGELQP